jgi:hypothetical protein
LPCPYTPRPRHPKGYVNFGIRHVIFCSSDELFITTLISFLSRKKLRENIFIINEKKDCKSLVTFRKSLYQEKRIDSEWWENGKAGD